MNLTKKQFEAMRDLGAIGREICEEIPDNSVGTNRKKSKLKPEARAKRLAAKIEFSCESVEIEENKFIVARLSSNDQIRSAQRRAISKAASELDFIVCPSVNNSLFIRPKFN